MDFPYEIRKVPAGFLVRVADEISTVSYSVQYEDNVRTEGAFPAVMCPWGWIICSVALICPDNDHEVLFAMAKEHLENLPDLKHKFMLVFNTGEWMFENCFLVATDDEDWWREFEVID